MDDLNSLNFNIFIGYVILRWCKFFIFNSVKYVNVSVVENNKVFWNILSNVWRICLKIFFVMGMRLLVLLFCLFMFFYSLLIRKCRVIIL